MFTFSGKVRSTLTLTLRVRSCLSWHLDARHPLTRTQCTEQSWCNICWWQNFENSNFLKILIHFHFLESTLCVVAVVSLFWPKKGVFPIFQGVYPLFYRYFLKLHQKPTKMLNLFLVNWYFIINIGILTKILHSKFSHFICVSLFLYFMILLSVHWLQLSILDIFLSVGIL